MSNPYIASHQYWDEFGNLVPNVEHSEGVRPHAELSVAPWLPLAEAGGIEDKNSKEYYSIMPGKILAISRDGYIVPAGLAVKIKAAPSPTTVVLSYTALDADRRIIDLVTGAVVTGTPTYTKAQVETALLNVRKFLRTGETLEDFISSPIGCSPYPYYPNASMTGKVTDPTTYRKHNFKLQSHVAVVCDYVLSLPIVPEQKTNLDFDALAAAPSSNASAQKDTWYFEWTDATYMPIAKPTISSTWSFASDAKNLFVNEKSRVRDVKSTGDYFVDDALNRIYFYHTSTVTAAVGSDSTGVVANFYHYNSTSDANINTVYGCVVGPVKPGDYLKPTAKSNWIPVTKANAKFALSEDLEGTALMTGTFGANYNQAAANGIVAEVQTAIDKIEGLLNELETNAEEQALIIGQVLNIWTHPRSALDRVRTYGENLPASMITERMPGSATNGMPDKLTYAGGSNKTAIVNIIRK